MIGGSAAPPHSPGSTRTSWSFVTNHAQVLACVADDPDIRLRDIAASVGITERAAQSIVADLVDAGYVHRTRVGRRNRYAVDAGRPMRAGDHVVTPVADLLACLGSVPALEPALEPAG